MKNTFLSIIFYHILSLTSVSYATDYYISPKGSNSNTGTTTLSPFQTIDAANQLTLQPGDHLYFERDGIYTGELLLQQSGTTEEPITISAYGNGNTPILSGASKLEVSSQSTVYCPSCVSLDNLVIDENTIFHPARYPNTGYLNMEETTNASSFTSSQLPSIEGELANLTVVAKTEAWVIDRLPVTTIDGDQVSVGATYGFHTPYDFVPYHGFFLSHHTSFLDELQEYYYNPKNDTLYLHNFDKDSITVGQFDNGITLSISIQHIAISQLQFEGYRADGISLQDNSHITIENCVFKQLGNDGVGGIKSWSSKNHYITVSSCTFEDILNTAINLYSGSHATITDNQINRCGLIPGEGMMHDMGYIGITASSQSTVHHNHLDSVGYSAISIGDASFTDVGYNQCSFFGLTKFDCGGVYCWSAHDNRIHHNFVYDGKGNGEGTKSISDQYNSGIYIDDASYQNTIDSNTVTRCNEGIKIHNAYKNIIAYNTLYANYKVQLTMLEGYPHYGDIIKENETHHNSFQCVSPYSLTLELFSTVDEVKDFGSFHDNVYNQPYLEKHIFIEFTPEKSPDFDHQHQFLTFEEWRDTYQLETNSYGTFDSGLNYGEMTLGNNLLPNSTFDVDDGWWWDYGDNNFSFDAVTHPSFTTQVMEGKYSSDTFYGSHLGTSNFTVEQDKEYLLTFTSLGTKDGHVRVKLAESVQPYTAVLWPEIMGTSMSTSIETHQFVFSSGMTTQSSLTFHSTSFDGTYYLEDVTVQEITGVDTNTSKPHTYNQLYINESDQPLVLGIPTGYIHQTGYAITSPITLAPYTSIVLKKSDTPIINALNEIEEIDIITMYPNPTTSILTLDLQNKSYIPLSVIDQSGKTVQQLSGTESKIDVSNLPSGIYFIQFSKGEKTITQKFIKQ